MSEDLQTRFKLAGENITKMSKRPDGPDLLKLYALFKQASEGDCAGARPGMLNPIARAKYDAWQSLMGTAKEEAMRQYAEFAESLIEADKKQNA
ncbi:MAG TPA: acyl-CoA-binding protein [Candidatus Hydrogenedentes bacterium]|nr:acyl-CoA-binding protein [Candidatus Hydrogenedentota bacterium]HPG69125.1 acyl-CoA-binding protein [Candidatus Hydrogenedentota bacterium]